MVPTIITAYVIGWVISAVLIFAASRAVNGQQEPAPHQFALSAVAGALWPLLVLGAVEFSSVAAASSAASHMGVQDSNAHMLVPAPVVPLR